MSDTLSEIDGQHVELLPARTVMSLFTAQGGAVGGGFGGVAAPVTPITPIMPVIPLSGLLLDFTGSVGGGSEGLLSGATGSGSGGSGGLFSGATGSVSGGSGSGSLAPVTGLPSGVTGQ